VAGPMAEWVEGPPVEPRPFGLFTAAQVVDDAEPRWLMGGARYEADYCGEATDSAGVCFDFGTLEADDDGAGEVTLSAAGSPDGEYRILWGDEEPEEGEETVTTLDGTTHTYDTPGEYTVQVTGPRSYGATIAITGDAGTVTAEVGISKETVEGIEVVSGASFAVLHMFQCNPVGQTPEGMRERARRALRMGEQRAVERVVSRALARHPDAVVLGGGTAVSVVDGLAMLERYAGANYPGRAVVHATPDVVTLLDAKGAVRRETSGGVEHIETVQGTRVAAGGGYSPLREPEADTDTPLQNNDADREWLYVTGAVQVRRSAEVTADALDTSRNNYQVLAERPYVVTWECITAAVLVATTEVLA